MKKIVVIGGGVAGIEASKNLSKLGFAVSVIERSDKIGGKLNRWDRLFPNKRPASELLAKLTTGLEGISTYVNTEVATVKKTNGSFDVNLSNGQTLNGDAILLSTGFDLFDAHRKEEYGYGIYDNVITSADVEKIFKSGKPLLTHAGKTPKRVGIIHCVGSRDEKAGNTYCSKVCCVTAVKQAIEIKETSPNTEVFCFYMDLRMFGRHFEDLYKEAQMKCGVQFIRGRLSEAFENTDGSIMLKAEDTLLGKPLKINVDIAILMAGMVPSVQTHRLTGLLNVQNDADGFIANTDPHYGSYNTNIPGVFAAGTCKGPRTLENTINEARAVALEIADYLK
jgi:heterodisulfide reductase subunit A